MGAGATDRRIQFLCAGYGGKSAPEKSADRPPKVIALAPAHTHANARDLRCCVTTCFLVPACDPST